MRERQECEDLQKQYLDFLRNLLKDQPYVALAYMTGILPLPHTDKPALVVELKYYKTADAAIRQIKDRQYTQVFDGYRGEILLTEINYNSGDKDNPQSCVIEKLKNNRELFRRRKRQLCGSLHFRFS